MPGHDIDQPAGLRERKKAKTRAAIQRHALRLFREQGYDQTTISQIAEAAEVSDSSFFRYFPTKEDLLRWDELDPQIIAVLRAQPASLGPIQALRAAFHEVLARLSPEEIEELRERILLLVTVLPMGATALNPSEGPLRLITEVVAERAGRSSDDVTVLAAVGAMAGACLAVTFAALDDPGADIVALIDRAMALLEDGLSL